MYVGIVSQRHSCLWIQIAFPSGNKGSKSGLSGPYILYILFKGSKWLTYIGFILCLIYLCFQIFSLRTILKYSSESQNHIFFHFFGNSLEKLISNIIWSKLHFYEFKILRWYIAGFTWYLYIFWPLLITTYWKPLLWWCDTPQMATQCSTRPLKGHKKQNPKRS